MSYSTVSICNIALGYLGASSIARLDEGSKESLYCETYFDPSRDATLRDHPWNFATLRRALAQMTGEVDPEVYGFSYAYAYPANCLFAREIVNPSSRAPIPFEVAGDGNGGRVILTDQPQAVLRYTARITDLSAGDPLFIEALSWKLAVYLAIPLTQSEPHLRIAKAGYAAALSIARANDLNEGAGRQETMASWMTGRTGEGAWK